MPTIAPESHRMTASIKKSPKKLNLYISEETQAAAQTLADSRSLSLSQLVTELIEESFQRHHANKRSDDWALLWEAASGLLKRLGGKLEQFEFGRNIIALSGKRIGVEFESHAFLKSRGAKLLQDLAFQRANDLLDGYLTVLPDRASPETIKSYEQLARESIYVPMMVTRINDLEAALKSFCDKKETRPRRKFSRIVSREQGEIDIFPAPSDPDGKEKKLTKRTGELAKH